MKRVLISLFLLASVGSFAQNLPAYQIYNKKGKKVSFGKMVKDLEKNEVVLFGELHNNALVHWLQLQVTKSLYSNDNLVLGAEMFEADDQVLLDEYLADLITENHFTTEGKMWRNYKTDYKPLLDFAKENDLKFIATNIPRRYASLVNKSGLEALEGLSAEAKKWIAPLPFEVDLSLSGYKWMIETMGNHAPGDPANIARSQASKDATMAHFIESNLEQGKMFIHYHGTFHSNNYQGIYTYLRDKNPDLRIVTIASVEKEKGESLTDEDLALADFILVTPKDSPKTY